MKRRRIDAAPRRLLCSAEQRLAADAVDALGGAVVTDPAACDVCVAAVGCDGAVLEPAAVVGAAARGVPVVGRSYLDASLSAGCWADPLRHVLAPKEDSLRGIDVEAPARLAGPLDAAGAATRRAGRCRIRRQRRRCGHCGAGLRRTQSGSGGVEYSCDVGGVKGKGGAVFWSCDACGWDVCDGCDADPKWAGSSEPALADHLLRGTRPAFTGPRCRRAAPPPPWSGHPAFAAEVSELQLPGGRVLRWGTALPLIAAAARLVSDKFPGCNPNVALPAAARSGRALLHGVVYDCSRSDAAASAVSAIKGGALVFAAVGDGGGWEQHVPRSRLTAGVRVRALGSGLASVDPAEWAAPSAAAGSTWYKEGDCLLSARGPVQPGKPQGPQRCVVHVPCAEGELAGQAGQTVTRRAEDVREVVGAVRFFVLPPEDDAPAPELVLEYMVVRPDVRGAGVGSALADAVAGIARAAGLPAPLVVSIRSAIPFWKRLGCCRLRDDPAYNSYTDSVLFRYPSAAIRGA